MRLAESSASKTAPHRCACEHQHLVCSSVVQNRGRAAQRSPLFAGHWAGLGALWIRVGGAFSHASSACPLPTEAPGSWPPCTKLPDSLIHRYLQMGCGLKKPLPSCKVSPELVLISSCGPFPLIPSVWGLVVLPTERTLWGLLLKLESMGQVLPCDVRVSVHVGPWKVLWAVEALLVLEEECR